MATRGHESLYDEGLEIVCSVTLQEAIGALACHVRREPSTAKRVGEVLIDVDRCKGCRLCIAACPTGSLELGGCLNRLGYHPARFLPGTGCTACGLCFYACPEPAAIVVRVQRDPMERGRAA